MPNFTLLWICLLCFGAAKKTCYFTLSTGSAGLRCSGCSEDHWMCDFPKPDDINHTMADFDNKNILGINELSMADCFIKTLYPGTFEFKTFVEVQRLYLNNNRISELPENLFHPATLINLKFLNLNRNRITYLSPKLFIHLPALQHLELGYNKLKTFEPGLFISNPIWLLELSGNNIELLPNNFFVGNISFSLRDLKLNMNKLRYIPGCLFQPNKDASKIVFPQLQVLDLGNNNLPELPNLFNLTNWSFLRIFDVRNNSISSIHPSIFHSMFLQNLTEIDVSYNRLVTLPQNLFHNPALANLRSLKLAENKIMFLPDELFHSPYLINLRKIDLAYNQIGKIPSNCFQNEALKNLEFIYLNSNNITSVTEEMFPRKLHGICMLNLANNKISSMGDLAPNILQNMIDKLGYFCKLDASYNRLSVQDTNFIQVRRESQFTINGYLDVSHNNINKFEVTSNFNKISHLPYVTVPFEENWMETSHNPVFSILNLVKAAFLDTDLNHIDRESLSTVINNLSERKLIRLHVLVKAFPYEYHCNCDMLKYLKLQSLTSFRKHLAHIEYYSKKRRRGYKFLKDTNLNKLKCGSPEHLRGKYLDELEVTDLQCEHSGCTDNKMCTCVETPYNNTVRINCTRAEMTQIPFFKQMMTNIEIYLGSNAITEFPILPILISVHVILLDLSYNLITNIPHTLFTHYTNMRILNLAENHLITIPSDKEWTKMNSLFFLEVLGNPFACSCSELQLKSIIISLNAKAIIRNIESIKCFTPGAVKGRVIYNLPDHLFGCKYINLVLIFSLTLSLLLFLLVVVFIAYVFRYYIGLFLFINFGWRFCYSYTKDETLYDTFISYSSKDSDWVIEKLMNPLENLNPPYNLCLHERDFVVGVPICDNITKSIEGSKCTICVVSKNWLESDWCQFEFRVAHCLATVEKKTRLLVILKEEIPKDKIEGDLKFYMKTFTYLDSAHPLFWSRLLNDLPRPDVEDVREENDQRDVIELT